MPSPLPPDATSRRDDLADFTCEPFAAEGLSYDVYRTGEGPAVVVLPEVPGLTPAVADLARRLRAAGFAVVVPSLFGEPGRPLSPAYAAATIGRLCVSSTFAAFAARSERPVVAYIRALARDAHARQGGAGVGVIGLCFTGGFALAAATDPAVLAPVAGQPSVPFPGTAAHRRDLGMSDAEADLVAERTERDGLCMLGLRFSADRISPAARFLALAERFGDAFRCIEIPSGSGTGVPVFAHSVLGMDYVDEPGHPTRAAYDEVVAFLRERLA